MTARTRRNLLTGLLLGAFFIALIWGVNAGVICSTTSETQTCQGAAE